MATAGASVCRVKRFSAENSATSGLGVAVGGFVLVGTGVTVGCGVSVGTDVSVGCGVSVGIGVFVGSGVAVGKGVAVATCATSVGAAVGATVD